MVITDDIQAKKEIAKTLLWELGLGFRVGSIRGTVKAELFRQMVYPNSTCQDWKAITWNMIFIHYGQSIKPCKIWKFCFMLLVYNCGHMVSNLLWNCECRTRHPNPLLPLIQESNFGVGVGARSIQIFPSFLTFSLAWMQGSICSDSLSCNLKYVLNMWWDPVWQETATMLIDILAERTMCHPPVHIHYYHRHFEVNWSAMLSWDK